MLNWSLWEQMKKKVPKMVSKRGEIKWTLQQKMPAWAVPKTRTRGPGHAVGQCDGRKTEVNCIFHKAGRYAPNGFVNGFDVDVSKPDKKWFTVYVGRSPAFLAWCMEPLLILGQSPPSVCCINRHVPGTVFIDRWTSKTLPPLPIQLQFRRCAPVKQHRYF